MRSVLELTGLRLMYGSLPVVADLSLTLLLGSRTALMGASGCGKTTLVRSILRRGGMNHPIRSKDSFSVEGSITVNEDQLIGYVPQEASLAPWLDAKSNIDMGLKLLGNGRDRDWISQVIDGLRLGPFLRRFPHELSLGTAKRVALARALVLKPTFLLLDEPFTGFDFDIRERSIALLNSFVTAGQLTLLMITHGVYEATHVCNTAYILTSHSLIVHRRESDNVDLYASSLLKLLRSNLG